MTTAKDYAPEKYYEKFDHDSYIKYYRSFRIINFKRVWKIINRFKKSGRAIDYGASFGWFVETAPKSWKVIGIEPSRSTAQVAKQSGVDMRIGAEDMLIRLGNGKKYDLVTMWNVIEHLPFPLKTLQLIRYCLNDNGMIALSFPNREGLINRMAYIIYFLSFHSVTIPLRTLFQVGNSAPHVFHFTVRDILVLLKTVGVDVVRIDHLPIVDAKNLTARYRLEQRRNWLFSFIERHILMTALFMSEKLGMHDEVVIIGKVASKTMRPSV